MPRRRLCVFRQRCPERNGSECYLVSSVPPLQQERGAQSSRAGSEAEFCHSNGFYVWGEEPVLLTCLMGRGQLHFLEALTPVTASPDSGFTGGQMIPLPAVGGHAARLGPWSFCAIPVISSEGGRGSFVISDVTCALMGPEVQSHSAVLHPCPAGRPRHGLLLRMSSELGNCPLYPAEGLIPSGRSSLQGFHLGYN